MPCSMSHQPSRWLKSGSHGLLNLWALYGRHLSDWGTTLLWVISWGLFCWGSCRNRSPTVWHDLLCLHPTLSHLSAFVQMGFRRVQTNSRDQRTSSSSAKEKVTGLISGMFATLSKLKAPTKVNSTDGMKPRCHGRYLDLERYCGS